MGEDARGDLRDVQDALLAFLVEQGPQRPPEAGGAFGRPLQESAVALVWGVVLLDELADVDVRVPATSCEAAPSDLRLLAGKIGLGRHVCSLC